MLALSTNEAIRKHRSIFADIVLRKSSHDALTYSGNHGRRALKPENILLTVAFAKVMRDAHAVTGLGLLRIYFCLMSLGNSLLRRLAIDVVICTSYLQ